MVSTQHILALMLFLLGSSAALAHPGKTDYQDAHRCLKNCGEWDLEYGEYHLHDKDRNPIRIAAKNTPVRGRIPQEEPVSDQQPLPVTAAPEQAARMDSSQDVSVRTPQGGGNPVLEEGMFQFRDMLLVIIAGLLVLVLLMLRRREGAG